MILLIALVAVISGIITFTNHHGSGGISLTSSSFKDGGVLPVNATCAGTDINPPFAINNIPKTAKSLAMLATDNDLSRESQKLPNSNLWLVFNIPVTTTHITEGIRPPGTITRDLKGNFNYNGPCPAKGQTEHVTFTVYALDKALLPINSTASLSEFQKVIKNHVVGSDSLTAKYTRPSK